MFVRRSRYNTLADENSKLLNELDVVHKQLAKEIKKNETKTKTIETLYSEAKEHAAAMSKKAQELKEAGKDSQRLAQLKQDMKSLEFDLKTYLHPAPTDPEQRALYVSRIAGYFNGGLQDYLNYLLAGFRAEISRFPLSERETDFYRAGINLCHLLMEWGDSMTQEHMANARGDEATQDAFDTLEDDSSDEAVENIKRSVNE